VVSHCNRVGGVTELKKCLRGRRSLGAAVATTATFWNWVTEYLNRLRVPEGGLDPGYQRLGPLKPSGDSGDDAEHDTAIRAGERERGFASSAPKPRRQEISSCGELHRTIYTVLYDGSDMVVPENL
jgi:hypothetical protein